MKTVIIFCFALLLTACGMQQNTTVLTVKNSLDIPRASETIEVQLPDILENNGWNDPGKLFVKDGKTNEVIASQVIDYDQDGTADVLIFQSDFDPGEEKSFSLMLSEGDQDNKFKSKVDARFVAQRKDDFAWENDRIAYRMYGPALQATGEISSGVDVWVKKVPYLILQKWYDAGHDVYHKDNGEGLDYYKAGPSRGCGGIAVLQDGKLFPSKNYTEYKIITNGPLRSVFELSYASWEAPGMTISEVKRISLDAGHNLNHFESYFNFEGEKTAVDVAIGIVKRDGEGKFEKNTAEGYLSYWEPEHEINGSTGCAVVISPRILKDMTEGDGHYLAITAAGKAKAVSYFAGAGWSKSAEFDGAEDWFTYVKNYALCRENPVEIKILAE